jgi:hypothetical protein
MVRSTQSRTYCQLLAASTYAANRPVRKYAKDWQVESSFWSDRRLSTKRHGQWCVGRRKTGSHVFDIGS